MARYHFRDLEDQRDERAFDVRPSEYRGQPEDFDERPDPVDLVNPKDKAWHADHPGVVG